MQSQRWCINDKPSKPPKEMIFGFAWIRAIHNILHLVFAEVKSVATNDGDDARIAYWGEITEPNNNIVRPEVAPGSLSHRILGMVKQGGKQTEGNDICVAPGMTIRCRCDVRCRQCIGKHTIWSSFNKEGCRICLTVRLLVRPQCAGKQMQIPPFQLPPFSMKLNHRFDSKIILTTPHPPYLQKLCPQNMPYNGGLYGIKVG